jgi:hypothetical protein
MSGSTDDLAMVLDVSLQMADRYGGEQVLVVLDLDNTLLAMEQGLGSDQWYYWQRDLEAEDPCNPMLVGDRMKVQGALFFASGMRPTQPNAAELVKRMQNRGLKVVVLTSRGPEYRLQTFRELRRNGFSFWSSAWPASKGGSQPYVPAGGSRPVIYEDGVYMVAGQDKGLMLNALFEGSGQASPKLVIFADDKQQHLQDVMRALSLSGTAVHAWRFTREDANVAALDPEAVSQQWDSVRPALETIEQVFGSDNFELPAEGPRPGCPAP